MDELSTQCRHRQTILLFVLPHIWDHLCASAFDKPGHRPPIEVRQHFFANCPEAEKTDAKFALQTLCAILLELPFYRVARYGWPHIENSAGRVHLAECPVHRLLSAKNAVPGPEREVMMMFVPRRRCCFRQTQPLLSKDSVGRAQ